MIPFNFIYYKPESIREAAEVYSKVSQGKTALYYAGGSEIITMCRAGSIHPDAIIDIKCIPECCTLSIDQQNLNIGAACTLNQISESKLYPLLRLACGRIADHTNQCRITLGGNLCGTIIYRETSLPLLLADASVTLFGSDGMRTVPFQNMFHERMLLKPGELIVQVHIPIWALSARHFHQKKTTNDKIDYPLVSVAAICREAKLRIAFSGVCSYPFRSEKIEEVLNDRTLPFHERVELATALLPASVCSDVEGSSAYRMFVFKNTLLKILEEWENGSA